MHKQFLTRYSSFCSSRWSLCGRFVLNRFRRHWGMIKASRFIYHWFTLSSWEPKDTEFPRIELEHVSKHWALLMEGTWGNVFSHSQETFKNKAVMCQRFPPVLGETGLTCGDHMKRSFVCLRGLSCDALMRNNKGMECLTWGWLISIGWWATL